jgi:hypothetical protein
LVFLCYLHTPPPPPPSEKRVLEEKVQRLAEEGKRMAAALDLRKRQFSLLMAAVQDLKETLKQSLPKTPPLCQIGSGGVETGAERSGVAVDGAEADAGGESRTEADAGGESRTEADTGTGGLGEEGDDNKEEDVEMD